MGDKERQHRVMSEILTNIEHEVWTKEDDITLLEQIQKLLPVDDHLPFFQRINEVKWNKVSSKFIILFCILHHTNDIIF